jgi:regulator of RNase E activity RraA
MLQPSFIDAPASLDAANAHDMRCIEITGRTDVLLAEGDFAEKNIVDHKTILARLRRLDACALSDAADQLGLPGAVSGLAPRTVKGRICGRVLTVKLAAGTPPGGSRRHLCTTSIEAAGPGDVIVIEQRTGIDAAGWGGMLSNAARLRGVSGVIVEGPARDIDEAAEIFFPVFSRAVTARTARGRVYETANGVPIQVGDVAVAEGDYVVADGSGAVFIAQASAEALLTAAEALAAREGAMTKDILAGHPISQVMGAKYETMLTEGAKP